MSYTQYLTDDAPQHVRDLLANAAANETQTRKHLLACYAEKPLKTLFQIDATGAPAQIDNHGPLFCSGWHEELVNAYWEVRVSVAPNVSQEQAIHLLRNTLRYLENMDGFISIHETDFSL